MAENVAIRLTTLAHAVDELSPMIDMRRRVVVGLDPFVRVFQGVLGKRIVRERFDRRSGARPAQSDAQRTLVPANSEERRTSSFC